MACREQILSEDYGAALVDFALTGNELDGMDYCMEMIDDQFAVLYFRRTSQAPISVSQYTYNSIPKLYGLMQDAVAPTGEYDPINLIKSGISQIQGPPLSLTGKGVVIGFIDTGIRYNLDVFRRPDGTSRIISIWDQTIQDGTPPEGFSFGTERGVKERKSFVYRSINGYGWTRYGCGQRSRGQRCGIWDELSGGGSRCGYRYGEMQRGKTIFKGLLFCTGWRTGLL